MVRANQTLGTSTPALPSSLGLLLGCPGSELPPRSCCFLPGAVGEGVLESPHPLVWRREVQEPPDTSWIGGFMSTIRSVIMGCSLITAVYQQEFRSKERAAWFRVADFLSTLFEGKDITSDVQTRISSPAPRWHKLWATQDQLFKHSPCGYLFLLLPSERSLQKLKAAHFRGNLSLDAAFPVDIP